MSLIFILYNLALTTIITLSGLLSAKTLTGALTACLPIPVVLYFIRRLINHLSRPQSTFTKVLALNSSPNLTPSPEAIEGETLTPTAVNDLNRRLFLKLIGSAGLATFLMAIFKRDAQAAFFGSVPGPGTVALKNTAGVKIDPAEKGPTDGYEITEVDDSTTPAYYGFVNKEGAWYIAREGATGEYRYHKGSDDFSTAWADHDSLLYDYFNNVF